MKKLILAIGLATMIPFSASAEASSGYGNREYCTWLAGFMDTIARGRDAGYDMETSKSYVIETYLEAEIEGELLPILNAIEGVYLRPYLTPREEGNIAYDNCMEMG